MHAIRKLFARLFVGASAVTSIIGLQFGLGSAKRAMEAARKLDQAYSGAAHAVAPEHLRVLPGADIDHTGAADHSQDEAPDLFRDDAE